jgi:DNA invertase Pin-like site-specific DNA recombinase
MLEYCRRNKRTIGAVFIYRLDRISRQTADYLAIRKKLTECDITLISATEPTGNSPTEKLVETMLAGFAQLDNDVRSERTKNGMRARFLSGLLTFKAPIGYINEGGYGLKDPETFDKVKKAWDLIPQVIPVMTTAFCRCPELMRQQLPSVLWLPNFCMFRRMRSLAITFLYMED